MDTIEKIQLEIKSLRQQLEEQKEKIRLHEQKIASRSSKMASKSLLVKNKPLRKLPSVNLKNVARVNLARYRYCNKVTAAKVTFIPVLNNTRLAFISYNVNLPGTNVNINDLPAAIRYEGNDYLKTPNADYNMVYTDKSELLKLKYRDQCCLLTSSGICTRYVCKFEHDESKVRLCSKVNPFKPTCFDKSCRLNHRPDQYNSPTCIFFQRNNCLKKDCIYTHKYEIEDTLVCRPFSILGYCEQGIKCQFKHSFTCPDLVEYGNCIVQDCTCNHKLKNPMKPKLSTERLKSSDKIQIVDDNNNENYGKLDKAASYNYDDDDDVEFIIKERNELPDLEKDFLSLRRFE